MSTLDPIASRSVSGHVKVRQGKRRSTWYAKWRDAQGVQRERKLGLAWEGKGAPPPGYLRPKDAEAQLQELLVEEWLAWGVRDRDWKPSTISENRSNVNAHFNPGFGARRIERITADDIEAWRDELVDGRGLSRRTANKLLINLGAIFESAIKHHGLLKNPAKDVPKLRVRYAPHAYDFFSRPTRSRRSAPPPCQTRTARCS